MPKQFLPLFSEQSLLQDTITRTRGIPDVADPVVVCSTAHRFIAADQLQQIGVTAQSQILEPEGRNTAPAVAVAAMSAIEHDSNSIILVLPADHVIRNEEAFRASVQRAVGQAQAGKLVTFGVVPTAPETGYGYIERGAGTDGCFKVARFVEKPNATNASKFLDSGNFYWNSGMFMFGAKRYLDELGKFRPDILKAAQAAWAARKEDSDFCRLGKDQFLDCPSDSIDYAVMEKTDDAMVVEADIGWSDIGSWSSLADTASTNSQGNVTSGDIHLHAVSNSYVRAESRMVAAIGVDDMVIVETADAVLVTRKEHAQKVKILVDALKAAKRDEYMMHKRVYRPWGYYEALDAGERYQVKRIMVEPGKKLSLQMHYKRAEHWVVVSGNAKVTCDNKIFDLTNNQSVYIPVESRHRLENVGSNPLYLIEVQSGEYLGEDDIVRFEDDYNRT